MTTEHTETPKWFKIVAIVAVIWNLMGVMAYIMQMMMTPEDLAVLPEEQRVLYENVPVWATGAFAIAVFGGSMGSIGLLIKKSWAFPVLVASLVGITTQMYHSFFLSNSFEVFGPGGTIMPIMVLLIGIYLVWLSKAAQNKGWIN